MALKLSCLILKSACFSLSTSGNRTMHEIFELYIYTIYYAGKVVQVSYQEYVMKTYDMPMARLIPGYLSDGLSFCSILNVF